MKNEIVAKLLAATVVIGFSGTAWSAVPLEATLDPSYYNVTHLPVINMSDINLSYRAKGPINGNFVGTSTGTTVLSLVDANNMATTFTGSFKLSGNISSTGSLNGGTFSFTSSDAMFGFGQTCGRKGCKANTGTVFGGNLTDFGWSDSRGFLEFQTAGLNGWACAQGWCTETERLWFNTKSGTLGLPAAIEKVKSWGPMLANGTAVIPVPAAAWLFGSGLLGLIGFARRKKK